MDLTGMRFGRLVVIGEGDPYVDPKTGAKQKRWLCQCDCGKCKNVATGSLKSGRTRSCGCYNKEVIHDRCFEDLTGKRFGMLTVLYRSENIKRGNKERIAWHCACDCGKEKDICAIDLKSGKVKSCGCQQYAIAGHNFNDLTGLKFGKLTVIKRAESKQKPSGNKETRWLCKCECGSTKIVNAYNLASGKTKSCGCVLSFGEEKVASNLSQKQIPFVRGWKFQDLLSSKSVPLVFDFALINADGSLNSLIEYQGMQHYSTNEEVGSFGKLQREETDFLKKEYCANHNIPLFEIKYDEDIEEKLETILKIAYENTVPNESKDSEV